MRIPNLIWIGWVTTYTKSDLVMTWKSLAFLLLQHIFYSVGKSIYSLLMRNKWKFKWHRQLLPIPRPALHQSIQYTQCPLVSQWFQNISIINNIFTLQNVVIASTPASEQNLEEISPTDALRLQRFERRGEKLLPSAIPEPASHGHGIWGGQNLEC